MAFELVNTWQEVAKASMTLIIIGIVFLAVANIFNALSANSPTYNGFDWGAQILRVAAFMWIAAGIITPLVQLIYDWLITPTNYDF